MIIALLAVVWFGTLVVAFCAGYLVRRWHRPSAGFQMNYNDRLVVQTVMQMEEFIRCYLLDASTPLIGRRLNYWPAVPIRQWNRLLKRMGHPVVLRAHSS